MSRWRPDSSSSDDDRCSEVHGRYQSQTFLDSTFTNNAFDVVGDGDDVFAHFGVESEIGGMRFHESIPPQVVGRSSYGSDRLLHVDDAPLRSKLTL